MDETISSGSSGSPLHPPWVVKTSLISLSFWCSMLFLGGGGGGGAHTTANYLPSSDNHSPFSVLDSGCSLLSVWFIWSLLSTLHGRGQMPYSRYVLFSSKSLSLSLKQGKCVVGRKTLCVIGPVI